MKNIATTKKCAERRLCCYFTKKQIHQARKQAYDLIDEIVIPKMFYRTDIGLNFLERDKRLLKKWGWI